MRVCFLVGSVAISGGTYVIVQHASYLQDQGVEVFLAVQEEFTNETLKWHDQLYRLNCISFEAAKSLNFDLVIATWWKTALDLGAFNANRYAYFVQSIESRFYPKHETPLRDLVESTYYLPVNYITEASWIKDYLKDHFSQNAALVRNGIRKDVYKEIGSAISTKNNRHPRILVEGHFGVSFKNTALAIQLAREAGAKDIWVLTGSPVGWLPGVKRVFSRVPMTSTADIYRSCDILIKLSTVEGMFGPPLEIFHCGGTAIVFNVTGHDEYIINGFNSIVVSPDNLNNVVKVISELLNDPERLRLLKSGATQTAANWPSWDQSSKQFHKWLESCLKEPEVDSDVLKKMTTAAWENYSAAEKNRLAKSPKVLSRYRLSSVAKYFPPRIVRYIKYLESIIEVAFSKRKVF
jgi:glycosyltransferase involved in cell wall biosynthesis